MAEQASMKSHLMLSMISVNALSTEMSSKYSGSRLGRNYAVDTGHRRIRGMLCGFMGSQEMEQSAIAQVCVKLVLLASFFFSRASQSRNYDELQSHQLALSIPATHHKDGLEECDGASIRCSIHYLCTVKGSSTLCQSH